MLKVGITGGIGSGKTTICKIFELLGIPVYYADDRAKWLMTNQPELVEGIKQLFGAEAYLEDGQLNRPHIAAIAFQDKSKLQQLNSLVHPAVGIDGVKWNEAQQNVPYTLKEAALLYESGSYQFLDKMITVFAPQEVRIERVLKRDKTTREAIISRIKQQMPEEDKMEKADFIIYNDGQKLIIPQVLEIHKKLSSLDKL